MANDGEYVVWILVSGSLHVSGPLYVYHQGSDLVPPGSSLSKNILILPCNLFRRSSNVGRAWVRDCKSQHGPVGHTHARSYRL